MCVWSSSWSSDHFKVFLCTSANNFSRDHFKVFLCEYAKNFTISLRTTTGKIKFQEATKPASQQIGEFVPAPAAAHNPCNDSIFSRKRRRKNKEKANKRLRAENK
uniref:Uncharacterized protein n=1 Tax=Brassica oleracea TaxID=3712 RepID=A0A3P6EDB9_BRAOL|nr:unnamed protein product [Brassica oleracea]